MAGGPRCDYGSDDDSKSEVVKDSGGSRNSKSEDILAKIYATPEWVLGHACERIQAQASHWLRYALVDDRDLALINASPLPWGIVGGQSALKIVDHKLKDLPDKAQALESTFWSDREDRKLLEMISEGGAVLTGFHNLPVYGPSRNWEMLQMNVNISDELEPDATRQILSGSPSKARVLHCCVPPWQNYQRTDPLDIMILRDFQEKTSSSPEITSRQFDILLMKVRTSTILDFSYPWLVLVVRDSGPRELPEPCLMP